MLQSCGVWGLGGPLEEFLHTLLRDAASFAMDTERMTNGWSWHVWNKVNTSHGVWMLSVLAVHSRDTFPFYLSPWRMKNAQWKTSSVWEKLNAFVFWRYICMCVYIQYLYTYVCVCVFYNVNWMCVRIHVHMYRGQLEGLTPSTMWILGNRSNSGWDLATSDFTHWTMSQSRWHVYSTCLHTWGRWCAYLVSSV